MAASVRVLVVDDSAIYRSLVQGCLREIDAVECVGTASDGASAVSCARAQEADLVLLDLNMPGTNGLEAIPGLLALPRPPGVVMVSSHTTGGASVTIEALQAGAFDFVPKPEVRAGEAALSALRDPLSHVIDAFRESRSARGGSPPQRAEPALKAPRIDVVVVGVSTGGPSALSELIPALPRDLRVPLLVVQHMPARFTASLADSLDDISDLRVMEATERAMPSSGEVLIAPGGQHMVVVASDSEPHIELRDEPRDESFRPSVDVLFGSLPAAYGSAVLSVVMTGMGADGLAGVRQVRNAGGYCLAQDPVSCAVYGMPRAVAQDGQADEIVSLAGLAARIVAIAEGR